MRTGIGIELYIIEHGTKIKEDQVECDLNVAVQPYSGDWRVDRSESLNYKR